MVGAGAEAQFHVLRADEMLNYDEISRLVEKTARTALGKKNVVRVFTRPGIDVEGKDALRITIVVTPDAVDNIDGDALLDNLLKVHEDFEHLGEERTPIVGYATEEELAEIGDPES
jgi:hypothetical protein